jgi:hypothetical protein
MTIPIVFSTGDDPVALGLVASLNRPGANVTGIANLGAELAQKQLQLLHELIPNATLFGVLADPAFARMQSTIADLQAAARTLRLQLIVMNAQTGSDLEAAFTTFSQQRVGAVLVSYSPRSPSRLSWMAKGRQGNRVKVTPADSFVAPKTNAGFDTYASEAVSLFRAPVSLLKRLSATLRTDSSSGPALGGCGRCKRWPIRRALFRSRAAGTGGNPGPV